MFNQSIRIATVWGIPIKLHASLLLLVLYLVFAASINSLDGLLLVLAFSTLLFASIAAHELGHSYVAIRQGCHVREITLLFMGGAAQMEQIPTRPRGEILMALAGPAVSLTLGLTAWTVLHALPEATINDAEGLASLGFALLYFVAFVNTMLGTFNLLPAFPMDGGRVLRAALTPRLGRLKATFIASRLGRLLAIGLIFAGLFGIPGLPWFDQRSPFPILIGFLVFSMAGQEYRRVRLEEMLRQGRAVWPFPLSPPERETHDAEVVVGPPPYARRDEAEDRGGGRVLTLSRALSRALSNRKRFAQKEFDKARDKEMHP